MIAGRRAAPRAAPKFESIITKNAVTESDDAQDHGNQPGPGPQGPQRQGRRRERDPDDDPQGSPEPVALRRRRVLERTKPVESDHPEAGEDVVERGHEAEEAEDRDEDGGIFILCSSLPR